MIVSTLRLKLGNVFKLHGTPAIALLLFTFAVYSGSFDHQFLTAWDDNKYVTANEAVKGFSLDHLRSAFSRNYLGNYAPLHIVSYMLDYSLWGMQAAGFVFTNILFHALNGILYYALLIKLTQRRLLAFLAGFIFLLHPVQVESVAWISQRKNLLAMFFFLISFLLYIAYRDSGLGTRDSIAAKDNSKLKTQNSKLLYSGSIAAFVCALLSKSVAVILPPVLLLYDLCFIEKGERRKWLIDKMPFIAAALLIAVVAMLTHSSDLKGGRTGYHGGSPLANFLTMLPVFVRYLGMLFWPANLSAAYNPPIKTGIDGEVLLSMLVLVAVCAAGFLLYRRRKDLFFFLAVFFIGFLPVSQIIPIVTLMNDRYLYFPMLGVAALIAGLITAGLDRISKPLSYRSVTAITVLLLLVLPVLSFNRVDAWTDAETLWTDAFRKDPDNPLVCYFLGLAYVRGGKNEAALPVLQRALSLAPMDPDIVNQLSALYLNMGLPDRAYPLLLKLVADRRGTAVTFRNLGYYYFKMGDLQKAEMSFKKSLELEPRSGYALKYLGNIYIQMDKMDLAIDYYRQAYEVNNESK